MGVDQKPNILVVDDIDLNAAVLELALQGDYRVLVASDGQEAVRILKKHMPIRAVITDVQMPVMNGVELVTYMKDHEQYRNIPIFVNTPDTSFQICSRLEQVMEKVAEI